MNQNISYELAQLNIAHAKSGDPHGPEMDSFWAETGRINALADENLGLVWRLQDEATGNASTFQMPGQDRMMVNVSIWKDVPSFIYRAQHAEIMARNLSAVQRRRRGPYGAVVGAIGHRSLEGWDRLSHLRTHGPTARALEQASGAMPQGIIAAGFDPPA